MVKVHIATTDEAAAWRVRDALASHPLLGGATAQISVTVGKYGVMLDGWALNEHAIQLAVHLACRAAGQRPVQPHLSTEVQHRSAPQRVT